MSLPKMPAVPDIDLSVQPDELETWDLFPHSTVAALDLLAITLADHHGWTVTVRLADDTQLTATPAPLTETKDQP
jgi:hypothetical protein